MPTQEEILAQYEAEMRAQEAAYAQASNNMPYAASQFGSPPKQNLVEWQLDFKPELQAIERLLRCQIMVRGKDGQELWIDNPDQTRIVFNNVGVNDILREIIMFLNKNKVLSNYDPEEIKPRIRMIGHELRMLIFNNYEAYGIDNDYKMNNYPIMVVTIISMIEDSYRRALYGEERKDLNQMRMVNQSEAVGQQAYPMPVVNMGGSKKKLWNPFTWGA